MLCLIQQFKSIAWSIPDLKKKSIHNNHNCKLCAIEEDTAEDEIMINLNGPDIGEADNVLNSALDLHFKGQPMHFRVKGNIVKSPGNTCQEKSNCHSIKKYCIKKKPSVTVVERI